MRHTKIRTAKSNVKIMEISQFQEVLAGRVEVRAATVSDHFDSVSPRFVATPHDEDAARALLQFCGENSFAMAFRGGGTKCEIGAPPRKIDVLVSSEKLTRVIEHDEGNATVTAESGISLAQLDEIVALRGQFVPCEYSPRATLGGVSATNFSGATRLRYGSPRDLIVGTHVALSDGRLVKAGGKVVKNVSGYDLGKLFIGSFGTLGLLTQVTLRLRPRDEKSVLWTRRYHSFSEAARAADDFLNGAFEPTLLRAHDSENGVVLAARFDGGNAAVAAQLSRVPGGGESRELSLQERRGECVTAPQRDENSARVLAAVPLQSALTFVENARTNGAQNIAWDCGIGCVRADIPPQNVEMLRADVEKCGGHLTVESAPQNCKTPDFVWGAPDSSFALQRRLKEKYDARGLCAPGRFVGGV